MHRIPHPVRALAVLSLLLAPRAAFATATDLVASTAGGDVVSVPFPAGTPSAQLIAPGLGGLNTPAGMTYGPDGYLYVTSYATNEVLRFHPDGTPDCGFVWPAIPGFVGPTDVLFDPSDGKLLVAGFDCGRVVRVDVSYGTWSDEFTAYANSLLKPIGLAFHPVTGRLLVADFTGSQILEHCDLGGGTELCPYLSSAALLPGTAPAQMVWRSGELFVACTNGVQRYREVAGTAAWFDTVAPRGTEVPAVSGALGLAFGPDGRMYMGDPANGRILSYTVPIGLSSVAYTGVFANVAVFDFEIHQRPVAPFPLPQGSIVTTYCSELVGDPFLSPPFRPDPALPVVIAVDARADGPTGHNWLAPKFWNESASNPADVWNAANLGPVFGCCLDRDGNIYVAATSAYGQFDLAVYPAGPGAVYKIDGATGAISVWLGTNPVASVPLAATPGTTTLPNTGPGLGDITYDPGYDVFYVSNLEDGRIYTVRDTPSGGLVLRAFDPFGNDELIDGTAGFPVRGERVYAVHSVNARILLWSGWLRDQAYSDDTLAPWPANWPPLPANALPNNTVFSSFATPASSGGPVLNGAKIWKVMPHYTEQGLGYSNPVTDITDDQIAEGPLSFPTRFLVAERSFNGDFGSLQDGASAHKARVLEYAYGSGWPSSGVQFYVGDETLYVFGMRNCAGGVAYEEDDDVWASGDALDLHYDSLNAICHAAYGVERIPAWGNAISPETALSNIIDLDEFTGYYNKSQPGDVEYVDFPSDAWGDLSDVCSGDAWSVCPCSNPGLPGRGCANSLNPDGALLYATGSTSVSADTVLLHAEGMPNSSALYFQGTSVLGGGAGIAFGDGTRCAGGTLVRLGTKFNAGGSSAYPAAGDPPVSVRGGVAPGTYHTYQVWYRNAAAYCTPDGFNLTNAVGGLWTP